MGRERRLVGGASGLGDREKDKVLSGKNKQFLRLSIPGQHMLHQRQSFLNAVAGNCHHRDHPLSWSMICAISENKKRTSAGIAALRSL
jgi:hypothetical protein